MSPFLVEALIIVPALLVIFSAVFVTKQYKRCPSNQILVVYGKVGEGQSARCIHGGGTFIVPLLQSYAFLPLEPISIDIDLKGALSKNNIRVNVPSTFTVGISTRPDTMQNAAVRLLGLNEQQIKLQASDIIFGQLRLVIATLLIEDINQDREKFLTLVNENVGTELTKIGLDIINVNIRDLTDSAGYIQAIGQKAVSEAVNKAQVEVAVQEKIGAVGVSTANTEKEVKTAEQHTQSAIGVAAANAEKEIRTSEQQAQAAIGIATAVANKDIATAQQSTIAASGTKKAEAERRVQTAALEADAVKGENESKATIAESNAVLAEKMADSQQRGEVATANAHTEILRAEKELEVAKLEKEQLAQQEVEKKKMETNAEAQAEQRRRIARGEADAVILKYQAEAEGIRKVLEAKAEGYQRLFETAGDRKDLVPMLLLLEQLPTLVEKQVQAVQNLKLEKVVVFDGGNGTTANFAKSLMGSLPALHEMAQSVGLQIPDYLGKLTDGTEIAGS